MAPVSTRKQVTAGWVLSESAPRRGSTTFLESVTYVDLWQEDVVCWENFDFFGGYLNKMRMCRAFHQESA